MKKEITKTRSGGFRAFFSLIPLRASLISLLLLSVVIGLTMMTERLSLAKTSVQDTGDPPWAMAVPGLAPRPPAVGNLSGVRVSIPHEYLAFGVTYVGESSMDAKPRERVPDFNTPIQSFSLLLRLSDLQPRRTAQDQKEWAAQMHSREANFTKWCMGVEVTNIEFPNHGVDWLKAAVDRYLGMKDIGGDEYFDAADVSGLTRKITKNLKSAPSYETQHDLMFDKDKKLSLITCRHTRRDGEDHDTEVQCVQTFYLDDLHAIVNLRYDDIYLENWRVYQKELTKLLQSFAMNSKTAK